MLTSSSTHVVFCFLIFLRTCHLTKFFLSFRGMCSWCRGDMSQEIWRNIQHHTRFSVFYAFPKSIPCSSTSLNVVGHTKAACYLQWHPRANSIPVSPLLLVAATDTKFVVTYSPPGSNLSITLDVSSKCNVFKNHASPSESLPLVCFHLHITGRGMLS